MHDHTLLPKDTLDEKVDHYHKLFSDQGKDYSKEKILKALELLSYKHVDEMPKNEPSDKPIMYIFRHGQTVDNANMIFCGWRDPDITELGKEQAEVLADKIKDKDLGMLIASDQIRAIKTMKIAVSKNEKAKDMEIHQDKRIKEKSYGDLQGTSKLEYAMRDWDGLTKIRRSFDISAPNGESVKDVCKRVAEFCDEIIPLMKENNMNVAISCHGNSIRGFRKYFEKDLTNEEVALLETPLGQDYLAYAIE